jgi:hypothetical protein
LQLRFLYFAIEIFAELKICDVFEANAENGGGGKSAHQQTNFFRKRL